jgi:cytidyltransferase-like protein
MNHQHWLRHLTLLSLRVVSRRRSPPTLELSSQRARVIGSTPIGCAGRHTETTSAEVPRPMARKVEVHDSNQKRRPPRRHDRRGNAADGHAPSATEPIRIFVAGTFDGLHRGHVFLLDFARRYGLRCAKRRGASGVYLTVVVARDASVRRIKGRVPHHSERERRQLVGALRAVDRARLGFEGNFLRSVRAAKPDAIVLGYDQSSRWEDTLRAAGFTGAIVRCPAYNADRLKSSRLRADIMRRET